MIVEPKVTVKVSVKFSLILYQAKTSRVLFIIVARNSIGARTQVGDDEITES